MIRWKIIHWQNRKKKNQMTNIYMSPSAYIAQLVGNGHSYERAKEICEKELNRQREKGTRIIGGRLYETKLTPLDEYLNSTEYAELMDKI